MTHLRKLHPLDPAVYYQFDTQFSQWPTIEYYLRRAGEAIYHHNPQRTVSDFLDHACEISDAIKAHGLGLMDEELHRPAAEVALADAVVWLLGMGRALGVDVAVAVVERVKMGTGGMK